MPQIIEITHCDPRVLQTHPDHAKMPVLPLNVLRHVRRDIQQYGIHSPLIVTPAMTIIDGVLRQQVAQERGWTTVPIVVLDVPENASFKLMVQHNQYHRPISWEQSRDYAKLLPPIFWELSGDDAMQLLTEDPEQGAAPLPTILPDSEDTASFRMAADRHEGLSPVTLSHSAKFQLQSPVDDWLMAVGALMWAQDPWPCWDAVAWKMGNQQGFSELLSNPTAPALEQAHQKILTLMFVLMNDHPVLSVPRLPCVHRITTDYPTWSALMRRARLLEYLSYGDLLWGRVMTTYFQTAVASPS